MFIFQPVCSVLTVYDACLHSLQYLYLSDEDYGMLLLYQTQSLLADNFVTQVSLNDILVINITSTDRLSDIV